MTQENLAKFFDHTILNADATRDDVIRVAREAKEYDTATVCVNGHWIPLVKEELEGTNVKPIAVIGFPLGANTTDAKVLETRDVIAKGAEEVDMVINIGEFIAGNADFVYEDIKAVADETHKAGKLLKVIIENCYLNDEQTVLACELSVKANADFVKTSTGFGTGGATVEDVRLMRETVGPNVGVKASGGIRTKEDVLNMLEAGASRIGLSRTVDVMNS